MDARAEPCVGMPGRLVGNALSIRKGGILILNSATLPRIAAMFKDTGRTDDPPRLDKVQVHVARIGQIGRSWTRNEPGKSSKATGKKNKRIRTRSGRRRKTRHLLLLAEGAGIVVGRIGISGGSASPLLGAVALAALPLLPGRMRGHLHIVQGTLLARARSHGQRPSRLRTRDRKH